MLRDDRNVNLAFEEISPFSDNFDVIEHFDRAFNVIKDSGDQEDRETMLDTLTAHHDNFIDSFKSVRDFQNLKKVSKMLMLDTLQTIAQTSVKMNMYAQCNATSLFQLWVIAVIREEQHAVNHIETRLAKFRTDVNY